MGLAWYDRHRSLRRVRQVLPMDAVISTRQRWWFWLGLVAFWSASDWPVGTLGAGYLASVHMMQYMIYTLIAAPLLLMSVPAWRFDEIVAKLRLHRLLSALSKPLPAGILANVILIATHAPVSVDNLRATQFGSFTLDLIWIVGGFLLWIPVLGPSSAYQMKSLPGRMIYLFLAAQLLAMIPGGFLTFANAPLYSTYELAPRVGLSAIADQQLAGAIMKVGSLPVIWTVIVVLWVRWSKMDGGSRPTPIPRPNRDLAS
jgi:putative membrane protein